MENPPEGRAYKILGWVRSKEAFVTISPDANVNLLCQNYYNKAVGSLVREAKKVGGDAVVQIRTVVFLLNGAMEEHKTPECSDDGGEGEILMKGVAIKWIADPNLQKAKRKASAK